MRLQYTIMILGLVAGVSLTPANRAADLNQTRKLGTGSPFR